MRIDRFTQRAQEAITTAQQLAEEGGNPQLEVAHLLLVLVDQPDGVVPAILERAGVDPHAVAAHLWSKDRIFVTPIKHEEFGGLRITPNLFTTIEEIETFVAAIGRVMEKGIS